MSDFIWQRKENNFTYSDSPRYECLNMLVRKPTNVLDIGCNVGSVGKVLRANFPEAQLWDCEFNEEAAKIAAQHYDHILKEDVTTVDFSALGLTQAFDMVCLFDVLEHLYNPWQLLQGLLPKLSHDAQVLVSLPNASHILVLLDALRGHWRYQNYGLLDFTHIRFFTDFDARKMFYQTGYRVEEMRHHTFGLAQDIFNQLQHNSFSGSVTIDKLSVRVESREELARLCAIQNLYRLTPHHGKLSEEEKQFASTDYPQTFTFGGE